MCACQCVCVCMCVCLCACVCVCEGVRDQSASLPDESLLSVVVGVGKLLGDLGKVYLDQGLLTRSVVTLERAHNIHVTFYGTHSHPHPEVN